MGAHPDDPPHPEPRISEAQAVRAFVERAPFSVGMTDRELRLLKTSQGLLADIGLDEADALGRAVYEVIPRASECRTGQYALSLVGETISGQPEPIDLPNGLRRWFRWQSSPWYDDSGAVGGILISCFDATEQMQDREEARRSRSFAETVLERSPVPIVIKDHDGRILMVNRAMTELYGTSGLDDIGKTVFDVFPGELAREIDAEDRKALACKEPLLIGEALTKLPRGERLLRKIKVAIRNGSDPPLLLAMTEDVTERRRMEAELDHTRAFLSALVEHVPIPLAVKAASDGRIVLTNRANEDFMGRSAEDLLGKTAHDLFPPEEASRMRANDREALESGQVKVADVTMTTSQGVRLVRRMKLAFSAGIGEQYILTTNQDMTDARRVQDQLESTHAFLTSIMDAMPVGVVVKDAATLRVVMANPAADELLGVDRNAHLGKTNEEVFAPEQAERFTRIDRQVIETGDVQIMDNEPVQTAHGPRFLRRKKVLIANRGGPGYLLSISEDVTERKHAQDELRQALAKAEAANVAKSEFLANMSHEIRTPLNGVLGLADAMARMDLTSEQREIVEMIAGSGKALTAILSDVLDLAKAEAGQLELTKEPLSLRETISAAAFLFRSVAEDKGVRFSVDYDDGPDRLIGDPVRIKQVVSNLISNAVKFTSAGAVTVVVGSTPDGDDGAEVKVEVRDTGPGFGADVRAKLFGRFEQGDSTVTRRYGGTGLGLSIARTLAQMMDGNINCSAEPRRGAAFLFTARLQIDRVSNGASGDSVSDTATFDRHLRVLLAEDHAVNQKVIQVMLGAVADLVITANGEQAVEAFERRGPFDLILMDTQMPVMDGLTAIRQIRAQEAAVNARRTPIISLTANAMAHQVEASQAAGADMHLAKPITMSGLSAAIQRALGLCERPAVRRSARGVG